MGYPGEGRIYDGWLTEVHVQDDAGVISHAARVKSKRSQSDGRLPAVFLRLVHDNVSSSYMICLMDRTHPHKGGRAMGTANKRILFTKIHRQYTE